MIERQNILDLIGCNKSKYNSCIITSFTFDFTFFEERIMSILRYANIKNVNVFVDGNYIDNYLEQSKGNEFKTHKTYSLNSIYVPGVFHPKIMFLCGPKHGLVVIGSGNLTSSGLSTNDEIWGAFHLNSIESPNAPLFSAVWDYLQQYLTQAKGFNQQKLEWIKQRSPWLHDIKTMKPSGFISFNKSTEIQFIANTNLDSTFKQLSNSIPKAAITKLTVVSPYYDETGELLNQLNSNWKPKEFHCLVDTDFGLPPTKIGDDIYKIIKFYSWNECLKEFDKRYNRLHAKLFHFICADGTEYLYLGSANATVSAFGSDSKQPINGEAGILLKRNINGNYLKELGVNSAGAKSLDIKSFNRNNVVQGDSLKGLKYENKILYSERNGRSLNVTIKKSISKSKLNVINSFGVIEDSFNCVDGNLNLKFTLKSPENAFKVYLSIDDKRISNYALIHDVAAQAKCNPDPSHGVISEMIESLSKDPENGQLIDLLRKTDYNWVDEEIDNVSNDSKSFTTDKEQNQETKTYDSITAEQFNELKSRQSQELLLLNNPSVQISDFLALLSRGLIKRSNIQDNTEEALANLSATDQTGEGEIVNQGSAINDFAEKESKAIHKHLDKVYKFYSDQLSSLHNSKSFQKAPKRPLTIKDLSNVSISLDLLRIYYGKQFSLHRTEFVISFNKKFAKKIEDIEYSYSLTRLKKINPDNSTWVYFDVDSKYFNDVNVEFEKLDKKLWVTQTEYNTNIYVREFMPEGAYNVDKGEGLKYYLIELLGSFLINANINAGFKEYDYDVLNEKIISLRKSITENALLLCLNIKWLEREYHWRNILILDIIHFISPELITDESINGLCSIIQKSYDKSNNKNNSFILNFDYFKGVLLPFYIEKCSAFSKIQSDNVKVSLWQDYGNLVYCKQIGFSLLKGSGKEHVSLEKPGFYWDDEIECNILKLGYPSSQMKSI